MGQVIAPNLDDAAIEAHRRRAKARGVSLEQELHDVLSERGQTEQRRNPGGMREIATMTPELPPGWQRTPAEVLIRKGLDSR